MTAKQAVDTGKHTWSKAKRFVRKRDSLDVSGARGRQHNPQRSRERAVFIVKPIARGREFLVESFIRGLGGSILDKQEVLVSPITIGKHYIQFKDRAFYRDILKYWNGKVVTVYWVELPSIEQARLALGGAKFAPGSFRAVLTRGLPVDAVLREHGVLDNGLHVSDSVREGLREYEIWFSAPRLVRGVYSPEYDAYLQQFYDGLYRDIRSLLGRNEYMQTMGSGLSGTHIEGPADLDFRVFVSDSTVVPDRARDLALGLVDLGYDAFIDREGVDPQSGASYTKLEVNFREGKADISVVPINFYRDRISYSALSALLLRPEEAAAVRRDKRAGRSSGQYKSVKARIEERLKEAYHRWLAGEEVHSFYKNPADDPRVEAALLESLPPDKARMLRAELDHAREVFARYVPSVLQALVSATLGDPRFTVKSDIKGARSLWRKKQSKGSGHQIRDKIRFVVLVPDALGSDPAQDAVRTYIKNLVRQRRVSVLKVELKEDPNAVYFGPVHVDICIDTPSGCFPAEVQVMPRSLWRFKELAHTVYKSPDAGRGHALFREARRAPDAKARARARRARTLRSTPLEDQ